jgi:hypothetical protein
VIVGVKVRIGVFVSVMVGLIVGGSVLVAVGEEGVDEGVGTIVRVDTTV